MNPCCEDDRAIDLLFSVLDVLDDGVHVLTALAVTPDGPMTAMAMVENRPGVSEMDVDEANRMVRVLSMTADQGVGGLVVRSRKGVRARRVLGWRISGLTAAPVSSAELFDVYCTDPSTGEPMPPEPYTEPFPTCL
ncbi:MAG TPA: hypothetical protein DD420_00950, partial [Streptomyces sp.]|nr:hypothetical protein [Streptomyces sp.]